MAAAVALAVADARAAGRTYNVGEEPAATERGWVRAVGRAAGWRGTVVAAGATGTPDPTPSTDWRYHLVTDTSRIRTELGYREPVEAAEAMARSVTWETERLGGERERWPDGG